MKGRLFLEKGVCLPFLFPPIAAVDILVCMLYFGYRIHPLDDNSERGII
jgi:hypothetical protein